MLILAVTALLAMPEQPAARWLTRPSPTFADYPRMAADLGISGFAVVECQSNPEGVPVNCNATSSRPAHLGFDKAALNIVQRGRVEVAPGAPLESTGFSTKIPFHPGDAHRSAALASWDGPDPTPAQTRSAETYAARIMRNSPPLATRIARSWRIDSLPLEQQNALQGWLNEEAPTLSAERSAIVLGVARLLASRGMDAVPRMDSDENRQWLADARQFNPVTSPDMLPRIREKYCAAFDCTSSYVTHPPSAPSAPSTD